MSGEKLSNSETYTAPELSISDIEIDTTNQESKAPKEEQQLTIDQARAKVLEQPPTHLTLPVDESSDGDQQQYIDRALKAVSLKNELRSIRQRLPLDQKILSKTIHQPVIRKASDVTSKTIARPIGLLVGGIFAFVGSLIYFFFDKYIGINYNYLVFVLLFILGYVVASLFELLSRSFTRTKNNNL